jgi:hypothetical protein
MVSYFFREGDSLRLSTWIKRSGDIDHDPRAREVWEAKHFYRGD